MQVVNDKAVRARSIAEKALTSKATTLSDGGAKKNEKKSDKQTIENEISDAKSNRLNSSTIENYSH